MFEHNASVLLILSQDVLDRCRVVAGKATIALKLPVSLQIVFRALIGQGLTRDDHPALLAAIAGQAKAIRRKRRLARHRDQAEGDLRSLRSGPARALSGRGPQRRGE